MRVVSKRIRNSAKGERCSFRFPGICNHNPETTVWCHINTKFKGVGVKSPDIFGAYGCSNCHTALDQNKVNEPQWVMDAMIESQMKLIEKGLIEVD